MKQRVTITLDPQVIKQAKSMARLFDTNLSALIEQLLTRKSKSLSKPQPSFSKKWAGKLSLRESHEADELLTALKLRYKLEV